MCSMRPEHPRVLFVESVHEELHNRLTATGFECEHNYFIGRNELLLRVGEFTGLVLRGRFVIDRAFIDAAQSLRFIARSGSGLEHIDMAYAKSKGIEVFSSPEGNRDAVGEHVVGMLLSLFNRIHLADREVRSGFWRREENRGIELRGKTVAIIGYGQMGSSVARKLIGFDCRVIAHDKYLPSLPDTSATLVSLPMLFSEADVVSLHLPLSEETHHYADSLFFNSFKKPIWFVNTARGRHTDTAALADAIKSGRVNGACLDVLEYEKATLEGLEFGALPEPLRYLYESEKVIFTPHVAGWTAESYRKLSDVLADKILAWWNTTA